MTTGRYWRIGHKIFRHPEPGSVVKESRLIAMADNVHVAQCIIDALNEKDAAWRARFLQRAATRAAK